MNNAVVWIKWCTLCVLFLAAQESSWGFLNSEENIKIQNKDQKENY